MFNKAITILFLSLFGIAFSQNITFSEAIEKGKTLTRVGDYNKALKYLEIAKQLKPGEHQPWQLVGIALYKSGKYSQAKLNFEKSKKIFEDDYVSDTYLGNIYIKENQLDKADTYLKRASDTAPEYPYAQISLGYLHIKQKDLAKGRMQMKKALDVALDDDIETYKTIGAMYMAEKMPKDAIYTYNKYINTCGDAIPKDFAQINYLLARIYDSEKNPRAEMSYRTAFEFDDKNVNYAQDFASYLFRKNKINEAFNAYLSASKIGKMKPENYYNLGLIYFNQKEVKSAVKYFELADKGKNKFVAAKIGLSAAYLRIGEYDKCILKNNEVIKLEPNNETAWYNNACAYAQKGDKKQTFIQLKKAIELNPENKKFAKGESMFSKLANDAEFIKLTN